MRPALLCLLICVLGCKDTGTRRIDPPPPEPTCGDGLLQAGEDCDGSEAGTGTCQSLGFDTGQLVCNAATCRYDTGLCVKRCGNGVLDLGEACDGTLGLEPCATWGFDACTDTCTVDTRRCVTTAFEAGPPVDMTKGGPAVIADVAPKGPGDLVMAVPSFARVELLPWSMTQGFDAVGSRKLSFQRAPVEVEVLDANGDGNTDLVTRNQDGTFDLLSYGGSSYSLQALDGGACAGATFFPSDGTPRADAVAVGCGGFAVLRQTGVSFTRDAGLTALTRTRDGLAWADGTSTLHESDGGTSALPAPVTSLRAADLDGDGDEDLAAITGAGVELFENTGTGYAARATFTAASPFALRAPDLDQDGQFDLFWATGEELVVRRNRGGWVFTEQRLAAGVGVRKSVALGDVDGDQDLDVAVTVATGVDSTTTRVFLNRVR